MKYEFKKGDRVKRINYSNADMDVGDFGIVQDDVSSDYSVTVRVLKEGAVDVRSHDAGNLVVVGKEGEVLPKTLTKPTHIVIWDEDRDPCKFFTDLNEAEKFIKELSEKSNVKKDSIILVEIKSAKKITIQKSLRRSDYKL